MLLASTSHFRIFITPPRSQLVAVVLQVTMRQISQGALFTKSAVWRPPYDSTDTTRVRNPVMWASIVSCKLWWPLMSSCEDTVVIFSSTSQSVEDYQTFFHSCNHFLIICRCNCDSPAIVSAAVDFTSDTKYLTTDSTRFWQIRLHCHFRSKSSVYCINIVQKWSAHSWVGLQ